MVIQIHRVVKFVTTGLLIVAGLTPPAPGQAVFIGLNDGEIDSSLAQGISADGTTVVGNAAFGDNVIDHYVHAAQWEQLEYDRRVTDWEVARGFERA